MSYAPSINIPMQRVNWAVMLSSDSLLTRYTFASPSLIYSLITFRMTVVSVNLPTIRPRGKPSL